MLTELSAVDGAAPELHYELRAQLDRIIAEVLASAAERTSSLESGSALSLEQLVTRLRSLYPSSASTRPAPVQLDELAIDVAAHEVRSSDVPVHLTRREFGVLRLLLEERDRALTREDILERVWGGQAGYSRRTVDIHVHRLRTKLGRAFSDRLQTLRNVGYKLRSDPLPAEAH